MDGLLKFFYVANALLSCVYKIVIFMLSHARVSKVLIRSQWITRFYGQNIVSNFLWQCLMEQIEIN